jgi:DNA/RNA-binding domain of Phe-tRNA-synthetase-like protein
MNIFQVSEACRAMYPGVMGGVLVVTGAVNPASSPDLFEKKRALEAGLRQRYTGYTRAMLGELEPIRAYQAYYGAFKKNYHVLFQLESVALKGKDLPEVSALVEAMFMAELENLLLTAGHDLARVSGVVEMRVATGKETYILLNGKEETLKPGDLFMADEAGVISSILYGPDQRTRIIPGTQEALFTVYAPPGIEEPWLRRHLENIAANARVVAPGAAVALLDVYR